MKIKFLRRNTGEYSRIGKKRKRLQKWRKPRGRDNKMRLRRKGYPRTVEIGYKKDAKTRGLVEGKEQVIVRNILDLEKVGKEQRVLIGKVGMKKRKEIVEKAKEKGIKIVNKRKEKEDKKVEEKK